MPPKWDWLDPFSGDLAVLSHYELPAGNGDGHRHKHSASTGLLFTAASYCEAAVSTDRIVLVFVFTMQGSLLSRSVRLH